MALNYNTLSATTERNVIPKLIDNVFDSNVVMKRLRKKGTKLGGGTDIQYPIIMASNSAGGAYQPESTLSTTPNEIRINSLKTGLIRWNSLMGQCRAKLLDYARLIEGVEIKADESIMPINAQLEREDMIRTYG